MKNHATKNLKNMNFNQKSHSETLNLIFLRNIDFQNRLSFRN